MDDVGVNTRGRLLTGKGYYDVYDYDNFQTLLGSIVLFIIIYFDETIETFVTPVVLPTFQSSYERKDRNGNV